MSILFGVGNVQLKVLRKVVYYVGISGNYAVSLNNPGIASDYEIIRALTIEIVKKTAAKLLKKYVKSNNVSISDNQMHKEALKNLINHKLSGKIIKGIVIEQIEVEKLFFRSVNVELPSITPKKN
jgi:hypothetical protein